MLGSLLKYCWQNFSISITYADRHELAQLVLVPCSCGRSPRYSYRLHDFYVTIPRYFENVFGNSFFPCRSYTLELFACKMLSFDQQFWTKYLQTFPRFSTISLNRKWKGTYVLSWEIECKNYMTWLVEWLDLGNEKISSKTLKCVELLVSTQPATNQNLCILHDLFLVKLETYGFQTDALSLVYEQRHN